MNSFKTLLWTFLVSWGLSSCSMILGITPVATPNAPTLRVESNLSPQALFETTDTNHKSFECRVEGIFTWTTCTSPFELSSHVDRGFDGNFEVRSLSKEQMLSSTTSARFRRGYMPAGVNGTVNTTAVQSDGKIILGGNFTALNPEHAERIVALASDGRYVTFLGKFDEAVYDMALQSDGKLLVVGSFTKYAGDDATPNGIARLNADGTEDLTFRANIGTGFSNSASVVKIQSDGKILVAGQSYTYNGDVIGGIIRLNADGTEDLTFRANVGTGFYHSGEEFMLNDLIIQDDGKIIIVGYFTGINGRAAAPDNIIRLNADGTEDTTFTTGVGSSFNGMPSTLGIDANDKILVGGYFTSFKGDATAPDRIIRLNADGTEDLTFRVGVGVGFDSDVQSLSVQDDGKILIGGSFTSFKGGAAAPDRIIRLNADGTEDLTFIANVGTGFNNYSVRHILIQNDDKIILTGQFTSFNGDSAAPDRITRLNADGTEDLTFRANMGAGFNGSVTKSLILEDDRILVAGYFSNVSGKSISQYIVRLNADQTEDLTFSSNIGTGFDNNVLSSAIQDDGKILLGGYFTSFNGDAAAPDRIIRLNADGTEDLTFRANVGTGLNSTVQVIAIQDDGKILLGGYFTSFNGDAAAPDRIIRLNADGTEDLTFRTNAGTGLGTSFVMAIAIQNDDKILIGGNFTSFNGDAAAPDHVIRLNANGSEDTTFRTNVGSGFNSTVRAITVQSDNKILIAGSFTSFNGDAAAPDYFIRLNSNGTEDTSLRVGLGSSLNSTPDKIHIQSDGKIVLAGYFTSFDGDTEAPDRIIRLNADGTEDFNFREFVGSGFDGIVYSLIPTSNTKLLVAGEFMFFNSNYVSRFAEINLQDP